MIDPDNIIRYGRSTPELQELWLFACAAAGKTAKTQARLLDRMLKSLPGRTPFSKIARANASGVLLAAIKASGLGMHTKLRRCYVESLSLKLKTATVEDFEKIHGCGPKTARMFIMHTRPGARYAALDIHILKHLRAKGIKAPKMTPASGPTYRKLEEKFLDLAEAAGMSAADYDLMVWREYASRGNDVRA